MYWLTKIPCPMCKKTYELKELKEIKGLIKSELVGKPTNGWPNDFCNWDIGLIKIYGGGIKQLDKPLEYLMQCFACGYTVPEKDLQAFIDSKSKKQRKHKGRFPREIYRPDRRIIDDTPMEKRNYYYAHLESFDLEGKLESY